MFWVSAPFSAFTRFKPDVEPEKGRGGAVHRAEAVRPGAPAFAYVILNLPKHASHPDPRGPNPASQSASQPVSQSASQSASQSVTALPGVSRPCHVAPRDAHPPLDAHPPHPSPPTVGSSSCHCPRRSACQCPPLAGRMCPHIVESASRSPHGAPPCPDTSYSGRHTHTPHSYHKSAPAHPQPLPPLLLADRAWGASVQPE